MSEPSAWRENRNADKPVTRSGYPKPSATVTTRSITMLASMGRPKPIERMSMESDRGQDQIDELDEDERGDDPAEAVDEAVAPEDGGAVERPELHPPQRKGDESRNDDGVVDHGGEDRRVRVVEVHHVQHPELGVRHEKHRRDDGEVLGDVVGDGEGRERPAGDE